MGFPVVFQWMYPEQAEVAVEMVTACVLLYAPAPGLKVGVAAGDG